MTFGPSLPRTAGSRVSVAASTNTTASMMPTAIVRTAGAGTRSTSDKLINTVSPDSRTALPAVSMVSATARRESIRPGVDRLPQGIPESHDEEQRVVDTERQREHHRKVHGPHRDRRDLVQQNQTTRGCNQTGQRQQQRQAPQRRAKPNASTIIANVTGQEMISALIIASWLALLKSLHSAEAPVG